MTFPGLTVTQLPALNAALNTTSALFLLLAFFFIRNRQIRKHQISIIIALISSSLFLISYLIYHFYAGHVIYAGEGWLRIIYFSVLLSHTLLAIVILPLIGRTLFLAYYHNPGHPRIGRITLALWLYVSLTGVIIFVMLRPYAPLI